MGDKKVYIHYVEWPNTKGNHAGIAHFCRRLKLQYDEIELVELKLCAFRGGKIVNYVWALLHTLYFILVVKKGQRVFYMEYLTKNSAFQEIIAHCVKKVRPSIQQYGMIHLSGDHLLQSYGNKSFIRKKVLLLNKVVVLGSSLEAFLLSIEIPPAMIIKMLHFVDHDFYFPVTKNRGSKLHVICMGHLKRNFHLLKKVVANCLDINFSICQGKLNLEPIFAECRNVNLYAFIPEYELRSLMQSADVSLNVLEDTVGSNVITTSMACGLAMVVSDVGSIRDYCSESNAVFCKNATEFEKALHGLNKDKEKCLAMQKQSVLMSENFSFSIITERFKALLDVN